MDKEIATPEFISFASMVLKYGTPIVLGYVWMLKYILKKTEQKIELKVDKELLNEKIKNVHKRLDLSESQQKEVFDKLENINNMVVDIWKAMPKS